MAGLNICDLFVHTQKDSVIRVHWNDDSINDIIIQRSQFHNKHGGIV